MGIVDCIVFTVGIVSGSGIFISTRGVLEYSGSVGVSLLVWAFSGLLSLMGALTYTELATMIPESGGAYSYVRAAFGDTAAFLCMWTSITIEDPTTRVIEALTFANYVLQPFFPSHSQPPEVPLRLLAALVIVFLAWLNIYSVKASLFLQKAILAPKVLILVAIISVGLYRLALDPTTSTSFVSPFVGSSKTAPLLATAFHQGLYTYDGWDNLNMVVEETKNPERCFPVVMTVSLTVITLVYLITNVAYYAVLSPSDVLLSPAVAVTFGDRVFGVVAFSVPVLVAISTAGALNGQTFCQSRVVFTAARHGYLPSCLALISIINCTPVPAIVFMTCFSLILLVTTDIYVLINYVSFSQNLSRLLVTFGLLILRYRRPGWRRPFKVWLVVPVVYLVVTVVLVVLPLVQEPITVGVALAVITLGFIIKIVFVGPSSCCCCCCYFTCPTFSSKGTLSHLSGRFYRLVQILFQALPEKRE
ncbi:hypothetical protein Pcinc_021143 [Petrolisthes cinctipes]|uniref:Amino acid transporter n=1 Tax=Petrolisthes cinctipes TaxID=88211 RepID=A0AAE1FGP2_PETCI|nr:hypothetical protein Pcinc_021143 [Petrolisthes cinctipes]